MHSEAAGDLRKVQLLQLQLLIEIDRLCKVNNLTYYIIAGTLLGAVRHGGFIPWDSDIDIAMFREDYEKLIKNGNRQIDSRFLINRFPRNNINRTLGLAFMGFFIVYITNLHYPSFNLHGNIELFFIMAAALSSSYEYACKEIYYSSNKYHI
jgi:phosphorylcholine metabolism protein LicD